VGQAPWAPVPFSFWMHGAGMSTLKPLLKLVVLIAFAATLGCGSGKDPNKNLKPIPDGAPKPEAVKNAAKQEESVGKVLK
jgi:hypothetical protein